MPAANIEKAVKRGTGELPGVIYEEKSYEGYGPGGVAILIETLTDNTNRTTADIRHLLSKHAGNLGETGCVSWMFEKKGLIAVSKDSCTEERLMDIVLDAGAEDISDEGEEFEVVCPPEQFEAVRAMLAEQNIPTVSAELTMIPKTTVKIEGKQADQMMKLMDGLDECDDVQQVYANFNLVESPEGS